MNLTSFINRGQARFLREIARWENNRRIRALADEIRRNQPAGDSGVKPVLMFNASTRLSGVSLNAAYSLLTGWSLRLKGIPVVHFVCRRGMSRCVLGTNQKNFADRPPCETCMQQSRSIYQGGEVRSFTFEPDAILSDQISHLGLEELSEFEYQGIPVGKLTLPSLRWILRRHHLPDDESTRELMREYILSAVHVSREFNALLDEVQPSCVVVFNGMFYPEATARWTAQQRGLRVITHEVGLMPFTCYFTPGQATAYPIDIPTDFKMSETQDTRLDDYLAARFEGNFTMAGIRFWPEMKALNPSFWERVKDYKQIVPVFTNVVFDTSQGHANVLYPHMFAWLDQVLEIMRAHPETFFVIRAHPDETRVGKQSKESVADWVEKNRVQDLPNVMFVDAGEAFSSYELILQSKFVMVYNSTIGLEASILGRPVLCGGKARFTQIPTVFFPESAELYRQKAEEFLAAGKVEQPAAFKDNSRRFLYYQLFKTSLPFEQYLSEDHFWKGYVEIKNFDWTTLQPEKSPTFETIHHGLLENGNFLLEE
ncbi:MAG: hypothetical protein AB9891_11775 [Anaerolineaceae bacterium]